MNVILKAKNIRGKFNHFAFLLFLFSFATASDSQPRYDYRINLNTIEKNRFEVELFCEAFSQDTLVYHFPWIIPGTYEEANYGKYIHKLMAYDQNGQRIKVKKQGKNTFIITPANTLKSIKYWVSATWDSKNPWTIWPMAGTGIVKDRVFAINAGGVFGYFSGQEERAVDMHYVYPKHLYAMTILEQASMSAGEVSMSAADYHELIDSPILFGKPDTSSFTVHGTDVLVGFAHETDDTPRAQDITKTLDVSMAAIGSYLDSLPAEEYAYLIYYSNEYDLGKILDNQRFLILKGLVYLLRNGLPIGGALEHNKSSFYYLPDPGPGYTEATSEVIEDIAIHEFMHILTPLNLRTQHIHNWDYADPVLSKHLWLYEGVTEYLSLIIQANGGMLTPKDFIVNRLQRKIRSGERFPREKMSFTEMSVGVLERPYKKNYTQVYQRGAVFGMLLDIEIIRLTEGRKRLIDVMYELIDEYGPSKPMDEEQVFDLFTEKVHPELRDFFTKYIEGREALPYAEILQQVGVIYETDTTITVPRHPILDNGGKYTNISMAGKRTIKKISKKNELGLKAGDKVERNFYLDTYYDDFGDPLPEGMRVSFEVQRDATTITLSEIISYKQDDVSHQLRIEKEMTPQQSKYFNIWLGFEDPVAAE
jgi:predicted metalloprotease with PDZ domain